MSKGPSLWTVAAASTGIILVWAGINDPQGGPVGVLRDLLAGKNPTPGTQKVKSAIHPSSYSTSPGGTSGGGDVVSVAMQYLGVKYSLGGASKNGIDCSGLVMVAFKQARGISLPHDASSQARAGSRIDRSQCQAGDLVAWGTPARYPHIAIATDNSNCIGAWTYGVPCSIKPIDIKAVPGYGLPTIFRIGAAGTGPVVSV